MAAQLYTPKPIEEIMKNLKVDSGSELPGSNMDASGDRTLSDANSCVSSAGDASAGIKESDADHECLTADGGMPTLAGSYSEYYYPGYASSTGATDAKGYIGSNGFEIPYPVTLPDNGSLVYYMPGLQPGYTSYGSYAPVTMVSVDGQFSGQQLFQPVPAFQPSLPSHGYYPPSLSYGELVPSPYMWDPSLFGVGTNGYGYLGEVENSVSKSFPNVSNHYTKASAKGLDQGKSGTDHQNNPVNTKSNCKTWVSASQTKARSRVNGNSDFRQFNEQNHGPISETSLSSGCNAEACFTDASSVKRDQYNLPDFQTKYDHAFFFVIKSYSEDDIHKSIKYNVWSSTPNGNRRLDSAYRDAQGRMAEKGSQCPVFLFFSVNASGQFCGVAEMIGSVDFSKNLDFWQQDKWTGYFPVKWHIVKDVPNPQLRHIILENNESKPVTNSRDTQEVKFPQGTEVLNIFKNYKSKTSILDDFDFYEGRQKVMQEKKIWQSVPKYNNETDKLKSDSKALSHGENAEQPSKDEVK